MKKINAFASFILLFAFIFNLLPSSVIFAKGQSNTVAPSAPKVIADPYYGEQYLITGINSAMEYKKQPDGKWQSCPSSDLAVGAPASQEVYYIRYKATGSAVPSPAKTLFVPAVRQKPNQIIFDEATESFLGIEKDMEYAIDDGPFRSVTEKMLGDAGAAELLTELSPDKDMAVFQIRRKATDTLIASEIKSISLYPRRTLAPIPSYDPISCSLINVTEEMQYRNEASLFWNSIHGETEDVKRLVQQNRHVVVAIRMKPVSGKFSASLPKAVIITKPGANPDTYTIHYDTETITGFQPETQYEYQTQIMSEPQPMEIKDGSFSLRNLITTNRDTILSIRAISDGQKGATAFQYIVLPKRLEAPEAPRFSYTQYPEEAVFQGVTTAMEYRQKGSDEWISYDGSSPVFAIPESKITYEFRLKATQSQFASRIQPVVLYPHETPPGGIYDKTTETISGYTGEIEVEWKISGEETYQILPQGTLSIPLTSILDQIPAGTTLELELRRPNSEERPYSKSRFFTLYPRQEPPSGVYYDAATQTIQGLSSKMQYRVVGTEQWKSVSGTSTQIKTASLATKPNTQIEIRQKPLANASASQSIILTLP